MGEKTKHLLRLVILISIIYAASYGFFLSLRFALGTEYPAVIVKGKSMEPTYYEGDILFLQGVQDKNNIIILDVIVFHNPYNWNDLIVHRVVEIKIINEQLFFITKGDNNLIKDQWHVQEENIVGRVLYKLPYLGAFVTAIQSPYGIATIFGLILFIIIIDVLYGYKNKRNSSRIMFLELK